MNIVDSSGWLEYFADTKNADNFAPAIEDLDSLITPTVIIYEIFKKICTNTTENDALEKIAHIKRGTIVELDLEIALNAAKLSRAHKLPMADSIILATAKQYNATIYTQDVDFKNIKGVKYFKKK